MAWVNPPPAVITLGVTPEGRSNADRARVAVSEALVVAELAVGVVTLRVEVPVRAHGVGGPRPPPAMAVAVLHPEAEGDPPPAWRYSSRPPSPSPRSSCHPGYTSPLERARTPESWVSPQPNAGRCHAWKEVDNHDRCETIGDRASSAQLAEVVVAPGIEDSVGTDCESGPLPRH